MRFKIFRYLISVSWSWRKLPKVISTHESVFTAGRKIAEQYQIFGPRMHKHELEFAWSAIYWAMRDADDNWNNTRVKNTVHDYSRDMLAVIREDVIG
jgi:hypothetical protein